MMSGALFALLSAVLFGVSMPLAKLLLGDIDPGVLAGLLYLGSGAGLAFVHFGRQAAGLPAPEAPLRRSDLPWLAAVILTGGVIAPLLLMVGLAVTPATSAALLLNLEGLATVLIAWLVFREHTDRRIIAGAFAILAGAAVLTFRGETGGGGWWGATAIAGACLCWGIDNNLTRKLSVADPLQITMLKGLVAGPVNLALATIQLHALPDVAPAVAACLVGFFGYGVSLVLFVFALRHIGTARTGAYFSTAPFIGAALAVPMFDDPITWQLMLAAGLMTAGVYLHLGEDHDHEHRHEEMEHEHRHVHDIHHQHGHPADDPATEPHSHRHRHEPLRHGHRHFPDVHHRHPH